MGSPLPGNDTTLLKLSFMDIPPYSARGLRQTLEPIGASAFLARTWNGVLIDLSNPNFQKYRTTISGEDQQPPAIDGIWPGLQVTIDCMNEIPYKTGKVGAPHKTVVAGSSRTEGLFTFYRPQLICRITNFVVDEAEWDASVSWTLEAEEI